jgi:hypothetical protein
LQARRELGRHSVENSGPGQCRAWGFTR